MLFVRKADFCVSFPTCVANLQSLSVKNPLFLQTELLKHDPVHTVLLCLHVADPATLLAPNCVVGTSFSAESSFFIQL